MSRTLVAAASTGRQDRQGDQALTLGSVSKVDVWVKVPQQPLRHGEFSFGFETKPDGVATDDRLIIHELVGLSKRGPHPWVGQPSSRLHFCSPYILDQLIERSKPPASAAQLEIDGRTWLRSQGGEGRVKREQIRFGLPSKAGCCPPL